MPPAMGLPPSSHDSLVSVVALLLRNTLNVSGYHQSPTMARIISLETV